MAREARAVATVATWRRFDGACWRRAGSRAVFALDLALVPDGELVATGSRSLERAEAFAAEFGGAAYGSYQELVGDPDVDVVYVASPHALHVEHT